MRATGYPFVEPSHLNDVRRGICEALGPMVSNPEDYGIIIMGSTAQGLDNERSDIDAIIVDFSGKDYVNIQRQLTHSGERRCELFFASPGDLKKLSDDFVSTPKSHSHRFETFLRIAYGLPLQRIEDLEPIVQKFPREHAITLLSHLFKRALSPRFDEAAVLRGLGFEDLAVGAMHEALGIALKLIVVQAGRYLPSTIKHLDVQLSRSNPDDSAQRLFALWMDEVPADSAAYLDSAHDMLLQRFDFLGNHCRFSNAEFCVDEQVSTIQIVSAAGLVREQDAFLIRPGLEAAAVALLQRRRVLVVDLLEEERSVAHSLYEHGLAHVEYAGRRFAGKRPQHKLGASAVMITAEGHEWPDEADRALVRLEIDLKSLSRLALCVFNQGIMYASAKEDAVGAIRAQNWFQVDVSLRKMANTIAIMALAYRGVDVIDRANWEYRKAKALVELSPETRPLGALLQSIHSVRVSDHMTAEYVSGVIDDMLKIMPSLPLGALDRCLEDGDMHEYIIVEIGNRLGKFAATVQIANPSGPRDAMSDTASAFSSLQKRASKSWKRSDDIAMELARLETVANMASPSPLSA